MVLIPPRLALSRSEKDVLTETDWMKRTSRASRLLMSSDRPITIKPNPSMNPELGTSTPVAGGAVVSGVSRSAEMELQTFWMCPIDVLC